MVQKRCNKSRCASKGCASKRAKSCSFINLGAMRGILDTCNCRSHPQFCPAIRAPTKPCEWLNEQKRPGWPRKKGFEKASLAKGNRSRSPLKRCNNHRQANHSIRRCSFNCSNSPASASDRSRPFRKNSSGSVICHTANVVSGSGCWEKRSGKAIYDLRITIYDLGCSKYNERAKVNTFWNSILTGWQGFRKHLALTTIKKVSVQPKPYRHPLSQNGESI